MQEAARQFSSASDAGQRGRMQLCLRGYQCLETENICIIILGHWRWSLFRDVVTGLLASQCMQVYHRLAAFQLKAF